MSPHRTHLEDHVHLPLPGQLSCYARFALKSGAFCRRKMDVREAREFVRRRLRRREALFLRILKKGVFERKASPYRPLFEHAQFPYEDVRRLVLSEGLEPALERLYEAGVFVTFEEFKARRPIKRGRLERTVGTRDFDNPFVPGCYLGRSGGSTGAGTRVAIDLDYALWQVPSRLISLDAYGLTEVPWVIYRPGLPGVAGLNALLRSVVYDNPPLRWFVPHAGKAGAARLRDRLAMRYICNITRLYGIRLPTPEVLPLDAPTSLLRWAQRMLADYGVCQVRTGISPAARMCQAALQRGLDLRGLTFVGGGEPTTPGKAQIIKAAGARHMSCYATTEAGTLALECPAHTGPSDLHVIKDAVAIIQKPTRVPGWQGSVDAFYVTTLSPASSKLMINVGLDDYGILEERSCDCGLGQIGYTTHVRDIRSYGKLTGEGVTLVRDDILDILEQKLPLRFGGSALDYQLLEEEDREHRTRLTLLVDPTLNIKDDTEVARFFVGALKQGGSAARFAGEIWDRAGTVRVRRQKPLWSRMAKLLPLRSMRAQEIEEGTARG